VVAAMVVVVAVMEVAAREEAGMARVALGREAEAERAAERAVVVKLDVEHSEVA